MGSYDGVLDREYSAFSAATPPTRSVCENSLYVALSRSVCENILYVALSRSVCENSLYVALSRSNPRLVIFQAARAVCPDALDAFMTRLGATCPRLGIVDPDQVVRLRVKRTPTREAVIVGGTSDDWLFRF
jgi:hypothetical protein